MAARRHLRLHYYFRSFFTIFCVVFIVFIILEVIKLANDVEDGAIFYNHAPENIYLGLREDMLPKRSDEVKNVTLVQTKAPIIIWWTPFTKEQGSLRQCGTYQCFFTENKLYRNHPKATAFLFYGTDFMNTDDGTLPLPRESHHEWALLHEESPKNNFVFSHGEILPLFNHTATFRRQSDLPLTLQHLSSVQDLGGTEYYVPTKMKNARRRALNLAPLAYVHADCDAPSGRDAYVKELMKYMRVDALGDCLHNRDLPGRLRSPVTGMDDPEFYKLMADYKFTLAFENAVCNDYITEKLWRPLILGSVPIYYGSPTAKDWLPTEKSAIFVNDFESPKDLANFINNLDSNAHLYEEYLQHKLTGITNQGLVDSMLARRWGINNDFSKGNFIQHFECLICERINENLQLFAQKQEPKVYIAKESHYGCPKPNPLIGGTQIPWEDMWERAKVESATIRRLVQQNQDFTSNEYRSLVNDIFMHGGID